MLSWRTARRTSGLSVAALLAAALLVPSPIQAAGSEINGEAPGSVATQTTTPAAPAKVFQQAIPARAEAKRHAPQHHESHDHAEDADHVVAELTRTDLRPFSMLGVTWTGGLSGGDTVVEVRWRSVENGVPRWTSWTELHIDPAPEEAGVPGTEPQWVGKADAAAVRVLSSADASPEGLALSTIDPGETPEGDPEAVEPASSVSKPSIISRSSWGANDSGSCDSPIYGRTTRGAVIHHTAGSNTYSKSESKSIVKATQAYHKGSRKWCDIGYNFLVDKYGQIFEGRAGGTTKPVRAAHSGNGKVNEETMGVSLMGTFSSATPSPAMKNAVTHLVAWRFAEYDLPGKGTYSLGGRTLNRIAGHRNVVGTECPGTKAYAWLSESGGLRDSVASRLASKGASGEVTGRVVANVSYTRFDLAWEPRSGAREYEVHVSTSSTRPTACATGCRTVASASSPVLKVRGLSRGKPHHVWVRALDSSKRALTVWQSAPKVVRLKSDAPSASGEISGRRVSNVSYTRFDLAWNPRSGATQYEVHVSTSRTAPKTCGTGCRLVTPASTSEPTLAVRGLSRSKVHHVWVRAVDPARRPLTLWQSAPKVVRLKSDPVVSARDTKTVPSSRRITVTGHGYGHGIGMSQYGAQGAAKKGVKHVAILSRYYPGTKLTTRTGDIRVLISQDTTDSVDVVGASGLVFRDVSARKTLKLPTSVNGRTVTRWRIVQVTSKKSQSTLQYKTNGSFASYKSTRWSGDGQFEGPSRIALVMPNGSTVKYRGAIRSALPSKGSSSRNTVNILPIEHYVRGVISAEMPSSWMPEALKAQAVAARTYGVRAMTSSRYYDICSTTSCQVYGGQTRETSSTDAAVRGTAGKILTYDGKPAFTQFSSSSGGHTAPGSQPYLKAVSDPYDDWSGNPNHTWTTTVPASTIEKAHTSIGTLKKLTITKRNGKGDWGGRVSRISLVGSKKTVTISGDDARWTFGLKSNWFRF